MASSTNREVNEGLPLHIIHSRPVQATAEPQQLASQGTQTPQRSSLLNEGSESTLPREDPTDTLDYTRFKTDQDIAATIPKGWPSIAVDQIVYSNLKIQRSFAIATRRVILDMQLKLAFLEDKLYENDKREAESGSQSLRSIYFSPEQLISGTKRQHTASMEFLGETRQGEPSGPPDTSGSTEREAPVTTGDLRDNMQGSISNASGVSSDSGQNHQAEYDPWMDSNVVLEAMRSLLKEYFELSKLDEEMRNAPKVNSFEHRSFYNEVRRKHLITEDAASYLHQKNDFVVLTPDRAYQAMLNYVFQVVEAYHWLKRCVFNPALISRKLQIRAKKLLDDLRRTHRFVTNPESADHGIEDQKAFIFATGHLVQLSKVPVFFASSILLLLPVGILFFMDTSDLQAFGIVVGFIFLFLCVATLSVVDYIAILLGLWGYSAVLVAFLGIIKSNHDDKS